MPQVWIRRDAQKSTRFHKTKDCRQLTKKPAVGDHWPLEEVSLEDLQRAVPCRTCYTDLPSIKMARRFCQKCNGRRAQPCAHNGGVPVFITYQTNYQSLLREPGDEIDKMIYVWPDRAHLFTS